MRETLASQRLPLSGPSCADKTPPTPELQGENRASIERLPTRFRHHGFEYRQIVRRGRCAIFEQRASEALRVLAYEVVRIRDRKAFTIRGQLVPAAEQYPISEAWGTDGFTLPSLAAAVAKLDQLLGKKNRRAATRRMKQKQRKQSRKRAVDP